MDQIQFNYRYDLIIRNGLVIDGTGYSPIITDIAIQDDIIYYIGDLSGVFAINEIDASDCYVSPGFIDVHSHSDTNILIEPSASSKIHQGVTTEIIGQCGASAFPLKGEYKMPSDWQNLKYPGKWTDLSEYRALLEQVQPALNIASLVGHNSLRAGVMGYAARHADPAELEKIGNNLQECLESGSRGMSMGLLYPPGKHAAQKELSYLARIVAEYDGILAVHIRDEDKNILSAIDEVLDIARQNKVRLQISHLKTGTKQSWDLLDSIFEKIEKAQSQGIQVMADRYPYIASYTSLAVLLPEWAFTEQKGLEFAGLGNHEFRARIKKYLETSQIIDTWLQIRIGNTLHPLNSKFKGRSLKKIAEELQQAPVDVLLEILYKDLLTTSAFFFGMSEDNMWRILERPWVMIGSDASLPLSKDISHPRAYGSFARFLRAVLDGKTVTLPEAVRKISSLPAKQFKLPNRGIIRPGAIADITIFTENISDNASYSSPHQLSTGFKAVIVNGVLTLENDKLTSQRAGKFL